MSNSSSTPVFLRRASHKSPGHGCTSFGTSRRHLPEARRRCGSTGRCSPLGSCTQRWSRSAARGRSPPRLCCHQIACCRRPLWWELGLFKARPVVHVHVGIHTLGHDQFASCLVRLVLCCDLESFSLVCRHQLVKRCEQKLSAVNKAQLSQGGRNVLFRVVGGCRRPCLSPSKWPASTGESRSRADCGRGPARLWSWGLTAA